MTRDELNDMMDEMTTRQLSGYMRRVHGVRGGQVSVRQIRPNDPSGFDVWTSGIDGLGAGFTISLTTVGDYDDYSYRAGLATREAYMDIIRWFEGGWGVG